MFGYTEPHCVIEILDLDPDLAAY